MIGVVTAGPEAAPIWAADWFELLRFNRFLGLVLLNFFDCFNYLLFGLILVALFAALRRQGEARLFVAPGLGFAGIAVFLLVWYVIIAVRFFRPPRPLAVAGVTPRRRRAR
jgi:hypothetical protein